MPLCVDRRLTKRRDHARPRVNNRPFAAPTDPPRALSVIRREAKGRRESLPAFHHALRVVRAPKDHSPTLRARASRVKLCRMSPTVSPPIGN